MNNDLTAHPGSLTYRQQQRRDLLRFAQAAIRPAGFGYLDDTGVVDHTRPVELYITCRMTHVFALGLLAQEPPAAGGPGPDRMRELATHGVTAMLDGPLRDRERGGWFAAVHPDQVAVDTKAAYAHAFVVLAASSALTAGIDRAEELLTEALHIQEQYFWDEQQGLVVEEWDAAWEHLDDYRGINSCMHTVEAYLAAGAALGEHRWHERAARIATRVAGWARDNNWRIPEHFDHDWNPVLEHNRDRPADPFRPYGATVGHALEWARLLTTVDTRVHRSDSDLIHAAVQLNAQAIADGWAADGQDGFVYTTDWNGRPVVHERMHWVLTEAIATSTVLHWMTGQARYAADLEQWWNYAHEHLIDHADGSWRHELGRDNKPSSRTWQGRPDVYHAYQAALMADTLGAASFAEGVKKWRR